MIIYGTRTYGRVDQIQDLGAVETKFFHVFWVPLIPVGSFFVFDDDEGLDDGEKRVRAVPFSFKSMITGWSRALLALFGLSGSVSGIMGLTEGTRDKEVLLILALGAVCWFLFFIVGALAKHCSDQRRHDLLVVLGYAVPPTTPQQP